MAPWKRFSKSKLSLIDESTDGNPRRSNPGLSRTPSVGGGGFLQSINSELQQTTRGQEDKINEQNQVIVTHRHTIEGLKEEKELLQSQVWKFSDQLTQSRREVGTLRKNGQTLEEHLQTLRAQVQVVEGKARVAEGKINEQMQELANRSNTIQLLSGHNQRLQNHVADLEIFVSAASRDTGTDFRAFFTHYSEVKTAHDEMASKLKSEEGIRLALDERLSEIQSENDSLKTVINELQKEASSLQVCQPQSLRALLTLRLVEQTWNVQPDDGIFEEPNQAQNWLLSGLSQNSLDEICSPAEIQTLANTFPKGRSYSQFYQRFRLTVCTTCSKAKFSFKADALPNFNSMKWLNEYVGKTRYFSCCHEEVCKECFKKHLLDTLETKWWYKLGTLQWFPCPRNGCENALGIRCEADLETCLEQFCETEAEQHVKT
jgi:predicted  nucleic acid-binding Zn-ribbon protein